METTTQNEDLKLEVERLKLLAELRTEKRNLKRQLRHINNSYLYDSWDGAKKDIGGFFGWLGKFLIDVNRDERRYDNKMETTTAQDLIYGVDDEREEFDNGCDFDFPDTLGVPKTPFTDI